MQSGLRTLFAARGFWRLWFIGGIANAVRWIELLTAALFTYEVTRSASAVAAVTAARTLPLLLFGAFAGAVAEALNRKHILVVYLAVSAIMAALVGVLAALGTADPWLIGLCSFVSGTVWASEMPTRRRMVGEIAGPALVQRAIAFDTLTSAATRMVGPVLGGIAYATIGLAWTFLLAALALAFCFLLALGHKYQQEMKPLRLDGIPSEILSGLRQVKHFPGIRAVLLTTIVVNALGLPFTAMVAPIGRGEFGVSPFWVGVLAAAEPLGALVGGLLLAGVRLRMRDVALLRGGSLFFFAALIVVGFAPSYAVVFAALAAAGLGIAAFAVAQSAAILTDAPAELRSRLLGIVTVCIGTGPLGAMAIGLLAELLGPLRAILAGAAVGLCLIAVAALSARRPPKRNSSMVNEDLS